MNAFIKLRSKTNLIRTQPIMKETFKNTLKEHLKASHKLTSSNNLQIQQPLTKSSKEFPNENTKSTLLTQTFHCSFRESFQNTKRTTELLNKISGKMRIISKPGQNKKNNAIQKFLDNFNKQNKAKKISSIKPNLANKENINTNPNPLPNIDTNHNNIHKNPITEHNNFILNQIDKINQDIKIIEDNFHKKEPCKPSNTHTTHNHSDIYNDSFHHSNPQLCEEYQKDIWDCLLQEQNKFRPAINYMDTIQNDITEKMRYILFDWIIEVHLKFKLKPETFYLTVNLVDRYLSKMPVNRRNLQLLGVTALFIACKYEEIYSPEAKDLIFMTDNAYKKAEMIKMENKVLRELNFDVTVNSPLKYLDFFLLDLGLEQSGKVSLFTQFLLEVVNLNYNMIQYNSCVSAISCLYIATNIYGEMNSNDINKMYEKSGVSREEILVCVKDVLKCVQKVKESKYNAVIKKYQLAKYSTVVNEKIFDSKGKLQNEEELIRTLTKEN